MENYFLEILTFHVIAVMSWMAMLFYMPRLFVYHQENKDKKDFTDIVKIQEDKIYRVIGAPAMWATIISGSLLIYINPPYAEADNRTGEGRKGVAESEIHKKYSGALKDTFASGVSSD